MANRLQWEPGFGIGDALLDAQHQTLLARCNALADCLDEANEPRFDEIFRELMALAREHFAVEEALLAQSGHPALEDYRNERAQFDYLTGEIATAENFDRAELQRFLALWWAGHVLGAVKNQRPAPARPSA